MAEGGSEGKRREAKRGERKRGKERVPRFWGAMAEGEAKGKRKWAFVLSLLSKKYQK